MCKLQQLMTALVQCFIMIVFDLRTQHHTLAVCFRSAENHCLPACFSIVVQTFATDFCRTMTSLPLNSGSPLPNFASPSGPSGPELGVWVPSWPVPNLILVRRRSRLPQNPAGNGPAGDPHPKFRARLATWGGKVGEGRTGIKGPWSRHLLHIPSACLFVAEGLAAPRAATHACGTVAGIQCLSTACGTDLLQQIGASYGVRPQVPMQHPGCL